jgi:hypothetical protein
VVKFASGEITLNGAKATLDFKDGSTPRLQATTEEINGKCYVVRVQGTFDESWVTKLLEKETGFEFDAAGKPAAGSITKTLEGDYYIKIADNQYVRLSIFWKDSDLVESNRMFNDEYDATKELYNTLATDFINAAEITAPEAE